MTKKDTFFMQAESMYIKGKTLVEISNLLGISQRTLSRWKKIGIWEEKRRKYLRNSLAIQEKIDEKIAELVERLGQIEDKAEEARTIDQISKLAKVKESFGKIGDLSSQALYVFDKFTSYIREREKDLVVIEKLQKHIHGFIRNTMEERK